MKRNLIRIVTAAALLASVPALATDLSIDGFLRGNCSTASATAGAATLANKCGVITTEALTAPASSVYTLTLTNTTIAAADIVLFSVGNGTNTTGLTLQGIATPAAGSVVITFRQATATNYNGTMLVSYFILKP